MNNYLASFPGEHELLQKYPDTQVLEVNAHIHTPYSFSAFDNLDQLFGMAVKESMAALGINDFFVTDGYEEFCTKAIENHIFPLFNIEFIGLLKEEQQRNIRVNDPNNPGRCYFSGKGLDYPFHLKGDLKSRLTRVISESQLQVKSMIDKTNAWLDQVGAGIFLDMEGIRTRHAKNLVRERHIAKALRIAAFEKATQEEERFLLLTRILGGKAPASPLPDIPALENEIRNSLLKAGGKAYVEEDEKAFMPVDEIIRIIVDAGGIPCYPALLDDKNGRCTEYEDNPEKLRRELIKRHIGCVELIPGRNDAARLQAFVEYFDKNGFVILMGTEHNSPGMIPLACGTRDGKPLNDFLRKVSWEGACVVAAHQYLRARGGEGYTDSRGRPLGDRKPYLASLGNAVIRFAIHEYK